MAESIPRLTIVIPCRVGEDAKVTFESLATQTFQDFKVVVIEDTDHKGANWARNQGFKQVDTELVLFSDNDISWKHNAVDKMIRVLDKSSASYCYGRYKLGDRVWGHQPWWPELLKHHNYISTMSVMRSKDFPGFDESITRLQDWDLWLTMLEQGKRGVYCNDLIFETKVRHGITFDEKLDMNTTYVEAERIVKKKHNLNEFTPQPPRR